MDNVNVKCRKVSLRGRACRGRSNLLRVLAFTLPEVLIAVAIFSVVATIVADLYIQSFRETRRSNLENQVYEDARFVMQRIAGEIQAGIIDYDEYYNQNAVIPTLEAGIPIPGTGAAKNFGQNFGRYYSAFFNPGSDKALGFDCNTVTGAAGEIGIQTRTDKRNLSDCTPLRKTIDKITGSNPFTGKKGAAAAEEDAFCGAVSYVAERDEGNAGTLKGATCKTDGSGAPAEISRRVSRQLYLISADGKQKTVLAREKISATAYALSILRLNGYDTNSDSIIDSFACAKEFQCRGSDDVPEVSDIDAASSCPAGETDVLAELPRRAAVPPSGDSASDSVYTDLNFPDACDQDDDFSKDFVPISPLRADVSKLEFYILPTEDPHYAFGEESSLQQPRVTIVLTIGPNMAKLAAADTLIPITLVQTVSSQVLTPIDAPLLVR